MRRRDLFLALGGGVVAASSPVPAHAQAARARGGPVLIGLLSPWSRTETEAWHRAFRDALRDLGWIEGVNARFEYRYANSSGDRLPGLVDELIRLHPDVLVASVTPDAAAAAKATKTIPIVMASAGDPIGTGLIASLARPGGNVTG